MPAHAHARVTRAREATSSLHDFAEDATGPTLTADATRDDARHASHPSERRHADDNDRRRPRRDFAARVSDAARARYVHAPQPNPPRHGYATGDMDRSMRS
jgi:hypothetical protein